MGAFLFLCVSHAGVSSAYALDASGTAVAVVQSTSASGPGGARTLAETNPVYSGDRIRTGGIGQAQILFRDDTRLVVGPNSSVVIDRFVYAGAGGGQGATVNFAKGAFRFISGRAPQGSYSVNTPTATIGIRGTEFDVAVDGKAGTAVLLFDGQVRVCSKASGRCVDVNRACGAVIASPDGGLHVPAQAGERADLIRTSFPLAEAGGQSALRADFRVNTSSCRAKRNTRTRNDRADFTRLSAPAPEPEKPHKPYKHKKAKKSKHDQSRNYASSKDDDNGSHHARSASSHRHKGKKAAGENGRSRSGKKGKRGGRGKHGRGRD